VALVLPADKSNATIILNIAEYQQTNKCTSYSSTTAYSPRRARSLSLSEVVIQKQRAATWFGATQTIRVSKTTMKKDYPSGPPSARLVLRPATPQAYGKHALVTLRIIRKTPKTSSTLSISSGSPMSFTAASTLSSSSRNYRRDMQFGFRISTSTKTTQESSPRPHILVFL
jgi:ubiquitin-protein ligase